jgi:hypothetical protein
MEDIEHYDIPVYNFPYDVEEDDEETIQDNSELRVNNSNTSSLLDILLTPNRRYFPLPSSDLKRKSTLTDNLFGLGYTHGVLPKSTIQSTRISAGFEVPY